MGERSGCIRACKRRNGLQAQLLLAGYSSEQTFSPTTPCSNRTNIKHSFWRILLQAITKWGASSKRLSTTAVCLYPVASWASRANPPGEMSKVRALVGVVLAENWDPGTCTKCRQIHPIFPQRALMGLNMLSMYPSIWALLRARPFHQLSCIISIHTLMKLCW